MFNAATTCVNLVTFVNAHILAFTSGKKLLILRLLVNWLQMWDIQLCSISTDHAPHMCDLYFNFKPYLISRLYPACGCFKMSMKYETEDYLSAHRLTFKVPKTFMISFKGAFCMRDKILESKRHWFWGVFSLTFHKLVEAWLWKINNPF